MSYFMISKINWVVIGILIIIVIEPHMITALTGLIETSERKDIGSFISKVYCINTYRIISIKYIMLLLNVQTFHPYSQEKLASKSFTE